MTRVHVKPRLELLWLPALLVALCAWTAWEKTAPGDYKIDAGTAVDALAGGDFSTYFSRHPVMGPIGTLFQTPWSYLGSSELGREQWAAFGCLLVLAGLGWYLSDVARRRGVGTPARTAIAVLCVVNPLTFEALAFGHPEELLTAALAIGAVVAACERRPVAAAVLLGLALATKQWAVIAVLPVLMVLPSRRLWTAAVAAAIAFAFHLPYLLVDLGAVLSTGDAVATGGHVASTWSVWYAASERTVVHLADLGVDHPVHSVPTLVQPYTHLFIIGLVLPIPAAFWAWRGRRRIEPGEAIALFALLALLRCVLDPNDASYYQVAFLVALFAWDALSPPGRIPLRSIIGVAVAFWLCRWARQEPNLADFNLVYLAAAFGGVAAIAAHFLRRERPEPASVGERAGAQPA